MTKDKTSIGVGWLAMKSLFHVRRDGVIFHLVRGYPFFLIWFRLLLRGNGSLSVLIKEMKVLINRGGWLVRYYN